MWTRALIGVYPVLPPQDLVVFSAISRCSRPDQLSSSMSAIAQGDDSCFHIDSLESLLDCTVRTTRAPHTEQSLVRAASHEACHWSSAVVPFPVRIGRNWDGYNVMIPNMSKLISFEASFLWPGVSERMRIL